MEENTSLQIVPLESNRALAFMKIGNEYRIDSRIIAKGCHIEHKHFIGTLRKYQNRLEKFGVLPFETAKPLKGTEGGRPETYVMLNKNQAGFAITLSRNTEQVVDFKFDLIEAFDILLASRPKQLRLPGTRKPYLPERGYHISHNGIALTPEQEEALVVEYVERLWTMYQAAPTANFVHYFVKRFSVNHTRKLLEIAARNGKLEQFYTPHTRHSGGKFKPVRKTDNIA